MASGVSSSGRGGGGGGDGISKGLFRELRALQALEECVHVVRLLDVFPEVRCVFRCFVVCLNVFYPNTPPKYGVNSDHLGLMFAFWMYFQRRDEDFVVRRFVGLFSVQTMPPKYGVKSDHLGLDGLSLVQNTASDT